MFSYKLLGVIIRLIKKNPEFSKKLGVLSLPAYLFALHIDQHSSNHAAKSVTVCNRVVPLTSDEGEIGMTFEMFESGFSAGGEDHV